MYSEANYSDCNFFFNLKVAKSFEQLWIPFGSKL